MRILVEIFLVSFRLGCTSFGGPTAHLGYFQQTYVKQKQWLKDEEYADLVALSQFLPGPASSQVGMGIGLIRGGVLGSIVSFIGFTMPSVLLLILFAAFYVHTDIETGWIQGLKLVAVAIVAHAIIDMAKKLLTGWRHYLLAGAACSVILLLATPWTQVAVIITAGIFGYFLLEGTVKKAAATQLLSKKAGAVLLFAFFTLLITLPLVNRYFTVEALIWFEKFYTAGALVFGGGHVVLPLLETQFVSSGIMSMESFLSGYGATQAVPGPLFTFAAYIGMVIGGVGGALWATFAIFLPAFLLLLGALPFWISLSEHPKLRGAIAGMNASVVGILTAAFFTPIVSDTISGVADGMFAILLFILLVKWKLKPSSIVMLGIVIGLIWY
ncbi:chromate efflux transporter [Lysinibacillus sp. 3P01SB]|uniref:chromate efflux transporter n=1 Tax=Lysinibacillus sp. 3P01SB TaxID=3132284 RepID=UPI0039A4CE96